MGRSVSAARLGAAGLAALLGFREMPAAEKFECLVEPYVVANVASAVPGLLDEVRVDRGDSVEKGQALASLKSDAERANLALVKARAEFAARKAGRNTELYRKQMISPQEKDELETEAAILDLELREAEEKLAMRTIRSPIRGVVMQRHFTSGEYVSDEPVLKLAQIDPLRVEVSLPVRAYGRVKTGMKALVEWEGGVAAPQSAIVTVVDPVVDAASGTIGVRLEVRNPARKLPAGTKCTVAFPGL